MSLIGGGMTRHRRSNIGRARAAERGNEAEYSASVTPELPRESERERERERERESTFYFDEGH